MIPFQDSALGQLLGPFRVSMKTSIGSRRIDDISQAVLGLLFQLEFFEPVIDVHAGGVYSHIDSLSNLFVLFLIEYPPLFHSIL